MYCVLFTNGQKSRIYSNIDHVFEDIKTAKNNYSNYYKINYIIESVYIIDDITNEKIILKQYK